MATIKVQYVRCWECQAGCHFDPQQPHTWMGKSDAEHAGLTWPLTPEQETGQPCACKCAGGPGTCVLVDGPEGPRS